VDGRLPFELGRFLQLTFFTACFKVRPLKDFEWREEGHAPQKKDAAFKNAKRAF
jgi:hypothetical protein